MMDRPTRTSSTDPDVIRNFNEASRILKTDGPFDKAVDLLNRNMIVGDDESMVLLGLHYISSSQNLKSRGVELFRLAADRGNTSGMRNLAYCYAVGIGVEKDKAAAAMLYKDAADRGNAAAACNYGVMLDFGNGVEQNFDLAFRYYLLSAEGGNTRGMTNLGEYYELGKGTDKDLDAAERWFLKSASPRAHFHLAVIYLESQEKLDREKGMLHLRISAEGGYTKALVRLAENSEGQEAINMYNLAARKGNQDAIDALRNMGLPVPETETRRHRKSS